MGLRRSTEGVVTFNLALPYSDYTAESAIDFFDRLLDRAQSVPGVAHAAFIHMLPIPEGGRHLSFIIDGRGPEPPEGVEWYAAHYMVSEDYLAAAGIPLLSGRTFEQTDRRDTEIVGLISETAARRFAPCPA